MPLPPSGFLVRLLSIGFLFVPFFSPSPCLSSAPFAATRADTLLLQAGTHRAAHEWNEAAAVQRELIRAEGGKDLALLEIVRCAWERGTDPALAARLSGADWRDHLPPGALDDSDRRFALALIGYMQDRSATASELLEGLVQDDPSRSLAWRYLAACRWELMRPAREIEEALAGLEATPRGPLLAHLWRCICGWPADGDSFAPDAGDASCEELQDWIRIPWVRAERDEALTRRWLASARPAAIDSAWTAFEERHGALVWELASAASSQLAALGTPQECATFFSRHHRPPGGEEDWLGARAQMANYLGDEESIWSLLNGKEGPRAAPEWSDFLNLVESRAPLEEALAAADSLHARSIGSYPYWQMADLWKRTGREDRRSTLRDEVRVENPAAYVEERVRELSDSDPQAALGLLDSLGDGSRYRPRMRRLREGLAEALSDTVPIAELRTRRPLRDRLQDTLERSRAALRLGRRARGESLLRLALETGSGPYVLSVVGRTAAQYDISPIVAEVTDRLADTAPGCGLERIIELDTAVGARDEKTIRRAVASRETIPLCPELYSRLALSAMGIGDLDRAGEWLASGLAFVPYDPDLLNLRTHLLMARGDHEAARRNAASLAERYPGVSIYRGSLLAAGGETVSLGDVAPVSSPTSFENFDHDLGQTAWIAGRRVDRDSFPDENVVVLRSVDLYDIPSASGYTRCSHLTMQVMSEAGARYLQTYRIPFHPTDGIPALRVARIVTPEGTTIDVPPDQTYIGAPEDQGADVGEERELVIPFPGLKPGSVIDVAYQDSEEGTLRGRWSFRHPFGNSLPSREEIVELRVREGVPLHLDTDHAPVAEAEDRLAAGVRRWRWVLENPPVWTLKENDPPLHLLYPWLGATTYDSWSQAGAEYGRYFWPQSVSDSRIESLAAELTRGSRSRRERLEAINGYVTREIQSVGIELDRGRFIPTEATEVLHRAYGDCKDKVALLIALLSSQKIEAWPVLVGTRGQTGLCERLPELRCFSHVLAYVPEVDGGLWCDPTLGNGCAGYLTPDVAGERGLVIPRQGDAHLVLLPASSSDDEGYALEIDVRPRPDSRAEVRIAGDFRGGMAAGLDALLSLADSAVVNLAVQAYLGIGLWESCRREEWHLDPDGGCGHLTAGAAYLDTLWASPDQNTVSFRYATDIANPISFPAPDDVKHDVWLDYPFASTVVLRLHEGEGWRADARVAPLEVRGPFYRGRISVQPGKDENDSWLEIRQEFRLDKNVIAREEYPDFWRDWYSFLFAVYQPYQYLRLPDDDRIAQLQRYARENPADAAFAVQAAFQILGSDYGGEGDPGDRRRAAARTLLDGAVQAENPGVMAFLLLAGLEAQDLRYASADSLFTVALLRDPSNPNIQLLAAMTKQQMYDLSGAAELMRRAAESTGSGELQLAYISSLFAAGDEETARSAIRRLTVLGGVDTTDVRLAQVDGLSQGGRCQEALELLETLETALQDEAYGQRRASLLTMLGRNEEAVSILYPLWTRNPVDGALCNNLAWSLALSGQNVERAEELAQAAVTLNSNDSNSRNTLAVVWMRQGRWKEAAEVLKDISERDQRPSHRLVNGYFLGLCEYRMGRRDRAIQRWREIRSINADPRWREVVERSLERASAGGDPASVVFTGPTAGER